MRLLLLSFFATAFLTASSSLFAQNEESLRGGSSTPNMARFEVSAAQQYFVARARSAAQHRDAIRYHYDAMGVDFAHPQVNAGVFTMAPAPFRVRRMVSFPGFYMDSRGYGF